MRSNLIDEKIIKRLGNQAKAGTWATTYLFTGNENERKKELAIAFAKALNCVTPLLSSLQNGGRNKVGGDSAAGDCQCKSCIRIRSGNDPDIKWYGLDEEANSIKISEVRDFKNWLSLKSYEAKVKVFIFNQAERLTMEAQNALLKSLEEPPPGNVILLFVAKSELLLPTISSRAIEIKVPPFSSAEIKDILVREAVEKNEAEVLSRMSQGQLTQARQAYGDKWFRQKNLWIDQLVKHPVSFLDSFQSVPRDQLVKVIQFLIEWFHDLLTFYASRDPQYLIHVDRQPLIEQLVQRHDFDSILNVLEELNLLKNSIHDYANQKLAITQAQMMLEKFFRPL